MSRPRLLRRRHLPARLASAEERFEVVLAHVERAREAMMAAVPVGRVAPATPAESLFAFDTELRAARDGMDAWRVPEIETEWTSCDAAIGEALVLAEAFRSGSPDLGFESLVGTIGDLLAPLEAFGAAADRFRALRR